MAAFLLPYDPDPGDPVPHVWTPASGARLPASLLSRLTEAADGHRTGAQIWLVGQLARQYKKGHKIKGPYGSAKQAFDADPSLFRPQAPGSDEYKIFGPFMTSEDFGTKQRQVEQVILVLRGGQTVCLDGARYDCVFWGLSAVDKFVVPYYVHIANLEEAEEIRDNFLSSATVAAIHIPGSEIIDGAASAITCLTGVPPEDEDSLALGLLEWKPGGGPRVRITPP